MENPSTADLLRTPVTTWDQAEALAHRLIPELSGGFESRAFQSLARQLLAAAVWHHAPDGAAADVERAVAGELRTDLDDAPARPLSASTDPRVHRAVTAVRESGNPWVEAANARNAAALLALRALAAHPPKHP